MLQKLQQRGPLPGRPPTRPTFLGDEGGALPLEQDAQQDDLAGQAAAVLGTQIPGSPRGGGPPSGPGQARLTSSFCRMSWVGLARHSARLTSGCSSSSVAWEALLCRLTLECLGSSSSSKLLNSGGLETDRERSGRPSPTRRRGRTPDPDSLLGVADAQEIQLLHHRSGDQRLERGRPGGELMVPSSVTHAPASVPRAAFHGFPTMKAALTPFPTRAF